MPTTLAIQPGQAVVISVGGVPVATGTCREVTARMARIGANHGLYSGAYLLTTGAHRQRPEASLAIVTADEKARIAIEIEEREVREQQAREGQRDREAQAAYDALPEEIKLSRSLRWLCDCESEEKIASAPLEHLRGIIAWAKASGLTTE